jgi:hypothetical protein
MFETTYENQRLVAVGWFSYSGVFGSDLDLFTAWNRNASPGTAWEV